MRLRIEVEGDLVGHAEATDEGRFALQYAEDWLDREHTFPVSLSLPLRAELWPAAVAHPYFANLLPEGIARDAICARLGISPGNDAALLSALGNDTAGALRLVSSDVDEPRRDRTVIPLSELARWASGEPAILVESDTPPRLSLAGEPAAVLVAAQVSRRCG